MKKIIEINDKNFAEVANNNENLLIDFHATWCGPCKMLSPVLDSISEIEELKTVIAKADIDSSPKLTSAMKIKQVPSIFFFKKGSPIAKLQTPLTVKNILTFIKDNE